jgi:hypothetical protein
MVLTVLVTFLGYVRGEGFILSSFLWQAFTLADKDGLIGPVAPLSLLIVGDLCVPRYCEHKELFTLMKKVKCWIEKQVAPRII